MSYLLVPMVFPPSTLSDDLLRSQTTKQQQGLSHTITLSSIKDLQAALAAVMPTKAPSDLAQLTTAHLGSCSIMRPVTELPTFSQAWKHSLYLTQTIRSVFGRVSRYRPRVRLQLIPFILVGIRAFQGVTRIQSET